VLPFPPSEEGLCGIPSPIRSQSCAPPAVSSARMMLYIARLATICARGRKRGPSAASSEYRFAAVIVRPVLAATVVVAPVTTPDGFGGVPLPVAKAVASSSSLASAIRRASAVSMPVQSWPDSIENGTKQCAFDVGIVGCASVGVLSVASVASATRLAVIAAAVRPRHSFEPTICSTLEIARSGFTTELLTGRTVGSSVYGTGRPVLVSENERLSSLVSGTPPRYFTNACGSRACRW
jgi:hypothetical protein